MTDVEESNHFAVFLEAINPPLLMPECTSKALHVLSAFPDHINPVYNTLYEGGIPKQMASKIDAYSRSFSDDGMDSDHWRAVLSSIDGGSLSDLSAAQKIEFFTVSPGNPIKPGMCAMVNQLRKVPGQGKAIQEKWTPLDIAKLYLTIYQTNYSSLIDSVMPGLVYDSKKSIENFKTRYPEINAAELAYIVSTISRV